MKPLLQVACAILVAKGRILITRRKPDVPLPNLWEFPGGKVHLGESPEVALVREIDEELGLKISVGSLVAREVHAGHEPGHPEVELFFYLCRILSGIPELRAAAEMRWVGTSDLPKMNFPPADSALIETLADPRRFSLPPW